MKDTCFIGLNVNSRSPYFTAVVVDTNLTCLLELNGNWEDLSACLENYINITIAVNSPTKINTGFLTHSQKKKHKPGKWPDIRRIEYELEEYGVPIYHTPRKKSNLLAAQHHGFKLVENLEESGFRPYGEDTPKQFLEVPSETAFWSIDHKPLFAEGNFIGQIQRQLLLLDLGIKLPDPMDFFEELTRFKLQIGKAPLDMILEISRLNAWMNAFTALKVQKNPSRVVKLGYPQEGFLYLPFTLPDWGEPDSSIQNPLF